MTEANPQSVNQQPRTPEAEHSTRTAWMFDIDGVVTNPETKQIKFPEISSFIAERVSSGEPVGLITGRALPWVMERVVPKVTTLVKNPANLKNLYVSGEFGGSYTTWKNGKETHFVDPNIRVPQQLAQGAQTLAQEYKDTQHVDPDKETMVSIEMNDGLQVEAFKPHQTKLVQRLREIVDRIDPKGQFEVHVDRIATNVRDKRANKYYAAEQFVKWANSEGRTKPDLYVPFGDSVADLEMPLQLKKMNLPYEFVYVGGRTQLDQDVRQKNDGAKAKGKAPLELNTVAIRYTNGHCDEGVVEYIKDYRAKAQKVS